MRTKAVTCILIALHLAACASLGEQGTLTGQPASPLSTPGPAVTEGIELYMRQRADVESVGFRLRRAAAPECEQQGRARADIGLVVWSRANFPNSDDRRRLTEEYGLTDAVTVGISIRQGPAEKAGIKSGDVVVRINTEDLPPGAGATARFIALSTAAAASGPIALQLADGNTRRVDPETVCASPTLLIRSPDMNAATDGNAVAITTGLYATLRSSDELAVILGHELAHDILGHTRSGWRADPIREIEADRKGLELAARAGFDIRAAPALWSRLNAIGVAGGISQTHPTGPERETAIREAVADILRKRH
jgi:hypothetical protein